jgi:hypothetical protein
MEPVWTTPRAKIFPPTGTRTPLPQLSSQSLYRHSKMKHYLTKYTCYLSTHPCFMTPGFTSGMPLRSFHQATDISSSELTALLILTAMIKLPSSGNKWCPSPFWGGVEPSPLLLKPLLAYCTSPGRRCMMNDDECGGNRWNVWQGKPKFSEKTYPSAALSTTNPT